MGSRLGRASASAAARSTSPSAARLILPAEPQTELLLLIDQFEELFTLCEDREERAHVLRSLVTATLDERSRLRIVVTLRSRRGRRQPGLDDRRKTRGLRLRTT